MIGVDALLRLRVDPHRVAVEQEAHDVQVVWRKVDHHADIADPRREGPEARRLDLEDAAQLARIEPAAQLADRGVEALDVPDGQQLPRVTGRGDHLLRLLAGRGDRLLDQDVGARLECGQGNGQVERGRRHDAHEVELLLGEHRAGVGVAARRASRRRSAQRLAVRVRHGHELDAGHVAQDADVVATHHPEPHDPGAQDAPVRHAVTRPASIGPSSAAVSLTAAITASTSASVSDGWTGMLSTSAVSRSVTGTATSP